MTEHTIVLCACGSESEAEQLAHRLVEDHLAACVSISAPVRSVFRWQGKTEAVTEWLLIVKTTSARFEDVSVAIQSLHSYELPEILSIPIAAGFHPYLKWITASVNG